MNENLKVKIENYNEVFEDEVMNLIKNVVINSLDDVGNQEMIEIDKNYTNEYIRERVSKGDYFVAIIEDRIIGVVGLIKNEVRTFFVDPNFQNKGIGSKLFHRLEEYAKSKKIKTLVLSSSNKAKGFYLKHGFKQDSEVINDFNGRKEVNFWMSKDIYEK